MSINCKSYQDLEQEAGAVDGFTLMFRTPTYLACLNSSFHYLFPYAVRVFSGLMRCWNLFSDGRRFSKEEYVDYKDWLAMNGGVCRYDLHTRMVVMRNKKVARFTGYVTYELRDKESIWNKTTNMLAHYTEYANIAGIQSQRSTEKETSASEQENSFSIARTATFTKGNIRWLRTQ